MVAELEERDSGEAALACPVLVTERLVLRPPHDDDVGDLAKLANNARISAMLSRMPYPYRRAHAQDFVARSRESGKGCTYALTLAESGAFIGCAGLQAGESGTVLGYWIGEPFWRRGFATEAAHALVDHAFRASSIEALHISCRVINPASRRVIHKCGFQYIGQGMMDSAASGRVAVERYRLDRRTWVALRSWPQG